LKTKSIKTLNAYTWLYQTDKEFSGTEFINATGLSRQAAYMLINHLVHNAVLSARERVGSGMGKLYKVHDRAFIKDHISTLTERRLQVTHEN
jgi:hypothetical protein